MSAGLLTAPAALAADARPTPARGSAGSPAPVTSTQPAPTRTPAQQAMFDAIAKAKSTSRPVVVDSMTSESSKTVANPNGTLTATDNAQAVRLKRDGAWVDLDASLRANVDGSISPTVASTALRFSGGGAGPMATVATADGKELAVGAPFVLPKPSLNGATATYTNVLPGVDLQLTALEVGGWRDVIVVRTPEAAADPALKTLRFPITAKGLTVTADAQGQIDVKDDAGSARFRSPASLQWDSSLPATAAPSPAAKSSGAAAPAAGPDGDPRPEVLRSSVEGPGDGANVAAMSTAVSGGAIELTPDPNALGTGSGPWYLDPSLSPVTSGVQGSVEVQENHETYEYYNKKSNLATGFCGYHSSDPNQDCGKEGRQRAYFQFAVNPAIYTIVDGAESPPVLLSSTLNGQVTGAASPGTPTDLGIYSASRGIHDHSKWTDQPCGYGNPNIVMEGCEFVGSQVSTGNGGPLAIDVTEMMKRAANGRWSTWTIGVAPKDGEKNKLYRRHLDSKPSITTTYDIAPTTWYPRTRPEPGYANTGSTAECTSGGTHPWDNPGWIGSNQNIYLYANSYSPSGLPVRTSYELWDDNSDFRFSDSRWGGSYNDPAEPVSPGSLVDGHQYGWYAQASDGLLNSATTAWCYFRIDRTNPRVSISSGDFPPAGTPNPNPTKYMNDWGTLWINGEDPAPESGLQASGIACVRVSTDPTPVVGWRCGDGDTYGPGDPYYYQARKWGINTVYAWARDVAGNYSQPALYNFYVPWRPGTQPLFGDVDNDQKPDIVTVDKNGNLRITGGTSDPVSSLVAPPAAAPGANDYGTTWADFQLSHHGVLGSGLAVDQIIAHYNKPPTTPGTQAMANALYLINNDGTGRYDKLVASSLKRPDNCTTFGSNAPCTVYNSTWSHVSQVIAFGSPDGEAVAPDPKRKHDKIMTSLTTVLTVEDGNLYLFEATGANDLASGTLIPAASGNWDDLELINPGAANGPTTNPGTGKPTNQTTLWARSRSTGDIRSYPLGWNANGTVDYSGLTTPDGGTVLETGAGLKVDSHPLIGAGDLNNDGFADLWVIDYTNVLAIFPGTSSTGTTGQVDGFAPWAFAGYADASVSMHSAQVDWLCADAEGGPHNGTELTVYGCWNTNNQRFNFASDGTVRNGSFCMSTRDNALENGTRVVLALCTGGAGQKWSMRPDGRLFIPATVNDGSPGGKCLELPGWATEQGTRLGIWDCPALQGNQRWTLQPERTG
ncbi:RICIN domain-containing protein [Kitasatospora purpeofusca]|uniref:RICIN domain-containing protein n=1 Tax=Kitasatospora purpeofusca TaxID=67352 RepID=UPI002258DD3A|nr:RICIN domain-containing protein [Kitasatospora purpeofusca]MCX4684450.1 RICIN domain-containing protein [Kitasatospora purpeofusca]